MQLACILFCVRQNATELRSGAVRAVASHHDFDSLHPEAGWQLRNGHRSREAQGAATAQALKMGIGGAVRAGGVKAPDAIFADQPVHQPLRNQPVERAVEGDLVELRQRGQQFRVAERRC